MSLQTDQLTQDVSNLATVATGLVSAFASIQQAFAALQAAATNPNPDISAQLAALESSIGTAGQVLAQAQALTSPATTSTDTTTSPAASA